jgi:DNA invertase Pin-like site-specific DNA recombinase
MIFGYASYMSTDQQTVDQQLDVLIKYGISKENIYKETTTSVKLDRPALIILRKILQKGDTLVTESMSRLSQSTKDLLSLVEEFEDHGIVLVCLKENINMRAQNGKLFISVLSAISQFEDNIIVQQLNENFFYTRDYGPWGNRIIPRHDNIIVPMPLLIYQ